MLFRTRRRECVRLSIIRRLSIGILNCSGAFKVSADRVTHIWMPCLDTSQDSMAYMVFIPCSIISILISILKLCHGLHGSFIKVRVISMGQGCSLAVQCPGVISWPIYFCVRSWRQLPFELICIKTLIMVLSCIMTCFQMTS